MTTANHVTDRELRAAIEAANLPPRDYRIYGALLFRVEWGHNYIPEKFQDRSLEALATRCRMSKSSVTEGLNHLERHGWVIRERQSPGRGRPTNYRVAIGMDCDCAKAPKALVPKTEAQRARKYRDRKRVQNLRDDSKEVSRIHVTKRPDERDEDAGQTPDSAVLAVTRGIEVEGWPADSVGAEINDGRLTA